jgi:hypothetical protein
MDTRLLILALTGLSVAAQDYRGSILGRITDPTGAVVPGAKITLTNEGTSWKLSTESNSEGHYLAPLLEPGRYAIEVEAAGFKRVQRSGLNVQTGDKITLNFELEVGMTSETVTVRAEAPLLQTASADIAQVIDRRFLDMLFISNRNPLALISLTPGSAGAAGGSATAASTTSTFWAGAPRTAVTKWWWTGPR